MLVSCWLEFGFSHAFPSSHYHSLTCTDISFNVSRYITSTHVHQSLLYGFWFVHCCYFLLFFDCMVGFFYLYFPFPVLSPVIVMFNMVQGFMFFPCLHAFMMWFSLFPHVIKCWVYL